MKGTSKDRRHLMKYAFGGEEGENDPASSKKPVAKTTPVTPAPAPKKRLTPKELKAKYKNNAFVTGGREQWGSQLDSVTLPFSKSKMRDSIYNVSKISGVNPALLYASAMEEGLGDFIAHPDDVGEAYPDKGFEEYPVDGFYSFGLDTFGEQYDKLNKGGYLPKGFDKRFKPFISTNEKGEKVKTAAFRTPDDAIMAKAAMLKQTRDKLSAYADKSKLKLTPKQLDFFNMVGYNAGQGNMEKMIQSYNQKGYLKDDKFLDDTSFKPASYAQVYIQNQRRLQNQNVMQDEGFFDDYVAPQQNNTTAMAAPKFAGGGIAEGIAQGAPAIAQLLGTIFSGSQQPMTQPIVNAQTIKNMATPYDRQYAMGGELGDVDDDQYALWLAMMMAGERDAETYNTGVADEDDEIEDGQDTAMEEESDEDSYGSGIDMFAMGGQADIEAEGNEVIQTPDGSMAQVKGPSHEEGGVDMTVPKGTKIYSDRLSIDGKTMQQRKVARERTLAKVQKQLDSRPGDSILKQTLTRTQETTGAEEAHDMAIQKVANAAYNAMQKGGDKFAYGDVVGGNPLTDYLNGMYGGLDMNTVPYAPGVVPGGEVVNTTVSPSSQPLSTGPVPNFTPAVSTPAPGGTPAPPVRRNASGLTLGDYIGLGANAFNAIAPIINTKNAAAATKPEVNRYLGFGRDAINANDQAQGIINTQFDNANRDIDTATATAGAANRNSARSVNTMRALQSVTEVNANKSKAGVAAARANTIANLLGQRGQLTNQRDQMEAAGATARDEREAQNIDNYYSNMAENLVNFGTNVGNIGRSINQHQANVDNQALLESMSEYFNFARDENGKLILTNKG